MIRSEIEKRNVIVRQEQEMLKKEMKTLPKEKLICCRNGNRFKWYKSDGKEIVYISKRNRSQAEKLAYKCYLEAKAEDLEKEKKANEAYLRYFPKEKAAELLSHKGYQELLRPFFKPISEELEGWKNAPYERNSKYPEQLIHQAVSGIYVRSKSEVLIDLALSVNQIAFRYECALELNGVTIYPDFTICHPKTGELYYWEHFGMVDKPTYVQNMCHKLNLYTINGIIPSVNLIMTFETKAHPLNSNKLNSIIQEYFL